MRLVSIICFAATFAFVAPAHANPERIKVDQNRNWDVFMKLYPKRALEAGEQGLVAFNLTLDRAGHPTACEVTHSSGYKRLDEETCSILLFHAVFQPPKDETGNRLNLFRTEGVINWRLPGSQAALKQPVKVARSEPLEKKICKRTPRTGTLAGFDRVCMTAREWDRTRTQHVEEWDSIRQRGSLVCTSDAWCGH